jgi:phosphatidylglycerol lysyltransferase
MQIKKILNKLSQIIGVCLFVLALVIIHYKLKHYRLHDIITQIKQFPPLSILLAFVFTILDYLVLTLYDALGLRYIKHPIKYSKLAFASFVSYVFSHNLTILGGSTARYRIYSALGVSTFKVARLIIFCYITFWLGLFLLTGMVFLTIPQNIPKILYIPFNTTRPAGVVFVGLVVTYILFVSLRKKPFQFRSWEIDLPSLPISLGQIVISSADWLLACSVFYSLLPAETPITFPQFLAIFMLAQLIGLFSYVPGGLGVFDSIILLLLSPYTKSPTIIGCLLLYRLIYYILPFMAATLILAIYELAKNRHLTKKVGAAFEKWAPVIMPHVLAFMCFIGGSILLFSGALPSVKGRMEFLTDLLPLPAIEISHFLASVIGTLLLLLARGLQRRISSAYHLVIILLVFGIIFSLLKGFDYEEAIILIIILLTFLPSYKEFYRKASIITDRLTPVWVVLIAIVISCSIWLGFFSYKHVDYSNKLWWQFVLNGDAPRFLRATSGVVIVILVYAIARLLHPGTSKEKIEISYPSETIEKIVAASKKTYSNLALLGDKKFLLNQEQDTFIMYGTEGKSCIAMGDPVGPEDKLEDLLWKFRQLCDRNGLWPVLYEIDSSRLDLYLDMGMSILKLGEEGRVNLNDFSLEGAQHRDLRSVHNKILKQDYTFEIIPTDRLPNIIEQLKIISDTWLAEKNAKEKGFSLGFFEADYISKFPIAVVRKDDKIIAFANIWQSAEKEECSIDLMRHMPDCPNGIMDYLFVELILWCKQTGYQWFNLGMAPLSGMEDNELAPLWHKLGTFIFTHGEHFYNFRGIRHYKEKFSPLWKPKYLACPKGLMLPRILTNLASLISGSIKGTFSK